MNRSDLEKLSKEEIIDLFLTMYDHFQAKIAELEARLNLNSQNSSKPPSTDTWKKPKPTRQKTGKKPGAQKGHKGHGLKIERQPDQIITHQPAICKHCKTNLTEIHGTQTDTRYKIDINIQTQLTQHNQITLICPNCQTINTPAFPQDLTSTIQYGEGVKAISVLFTHYAMVSYDKTQKILNDIFDIPISTGTIVNHVSEFTQKAEPVLNGIPIKLQGESVLHFDETGVNVETEKHWLHTASSDGATFITVHPKRGQAGTDDNGVLKEFRGTAVHDCWKSYFRYEYCRHGLCNAHLLRELQGVVENTGQVWAGLMMGFLRGLKLVVERCKALGVVVLPVVIVRVLEWSMGVFWRWVWGRILWLWVCGSVLRCGVF
jgi:transposase